MHPERNLELTEGIVAFLRDIGLEVQKRVIDGDPVLPGIKVDQGVLLYDPARLQFPGDLLHEAGHLAVKSPADRKLAGMDTVALLAMAAFGISTWIMFGIEKTVRAQNT